MKNIRIFYLKIFIFFLKVQFSVYLNRHVFAMPFYHYENTPIQIYRNFHQKPTIFQVKNSDIFHISAQNIDCGYSLELPR